MSQYRYDLTPWTPDQPPYAWWEITEPTSRRLAFGVHGYRDPERPEGVPRTVVKRADAKRLTLTEDNRGDNALEIIASSKAEFHAIMDSPGHKEWFANLPRYGTWAWYLAEVKLVRYIFDFCGWTATPEEAQLMEALEEYGKRAPAQYVTAA
jgi:hypothetical protein